MSCPRCRNTLPLHRRHLTVSQASMCAARAHDLYAKAAKERMLSGKKADPVVNSTQGTTGKARDQAGRDFGVSGWAVGKAKTVLDSGMPDLVQAVDSGRISLNAGDLGLPEVRALQAGQDAEIAPVAPIDELVPEWREGCPDGE